MEIILLVGEDVAWDTNRWGAAKWRAYDLLGARTIFRVGESVRLGRAPRKTLFERHEEPAIPFSGKRGRIWLMVSSVTRANNTYTITVEYFGLDKNFKNFEKSIGSGLHGEPVLREIYETLWRGEIFVIRPIRPEGSGPGIESSVRGVGRHMPVEPSVTSLAIGYALQCHERAAEMVVRRGVRRVSDIVGGVTVEENDNNHVWLRPVQRDALVSIIRGDRSEFNFPKCTLEESLPVMAVKWREIVTLERTSDAACLHRVAATDLLVRQSASTLAERLPARRSILVGHCARSGDRLKKSGGLLMTYQMGSAVGWNVSKGIERMRFEIEQKGTEPNVVSERMRGITGGLLKKSAGTPEFVGSGNFALNVGAKTKCGYQPDLGLPLDMRAATAEIGIFTTNAVSGIGNAVGDNMISRGLQ